MSAYSGDVLFIHIPKTGGTAVKDYMAQCGSISTEGFSTGHVRLIDTVKATGRPVDSWRVIIAAIRDPYAQQVSQWRFWADRYARGQRHADDIRAASSPDMTSWLSSDAGGGRWGYYRQWICNELGEIPTNVTLIRQEELAEQFESVSGMTGGTFRNINAMGTRNVMEYYNSERFTGQALDVVEAKFAWTFSQGFYSKAVRV